MADRRETYKKKSIDLSAGNVTVSPRPALLGYIKISQTISAHAVEIYDGADYVDEVAASATADNIYAYADIEIDSNLIIKPNASATGKILVAYRDLV